MQTRKTKPNLPQKFFNPHRLLHGVWLPQWLEDHFEVSEKAKKLYAHLGLTYFAGGKGYAWPTLNTLAEKLHVSRRQVIRLVNELSEHRLIFVTNKNRARLLSGRVGDAYRSEEMGCFRWLWWK